MDGDPSQDRGEAAEQDGTDEPTVVSLRGGKKDGKGGATEETEAFLTEAGRRRGIFTTAASDRGPDPPARSRTRILMWARP